MVSKTKIDLITNVAAIDQVHHWLMAQVMSEKQHVECSNTASDIHYGRGMRRQIFFERMKIRFDLSNVRPFNCLPPPPSLQMEADQPPRGAAHRIGLQLRAL